MIRIKSLTAWHVFFGFNYFRGGVKKSGTFGWWGPLGGGGHNFRPKRYHFFVFASIDAEAFKTCKNTIKLIDLGY